MTYPRHLGRDRTVLLKHSPGALVWFSDSFLNLDSQHSLRAPVFGYPLRTHSAAQYQCFLRHNLDIHLLTQPAVTMAERHLGTPKTSLTGLWLGVGARKKDLLGL